MNKLIPKKDLKKFFNNLTTQYTVIGPKKKNNIYIFDKITNLEDLRLDYTNTVYPLKKYFLPDKEVIFRFKNNKISTEEEYPKIAILGIRTCDIHAITVMDKLFLTDPYYKQRKQNILIIGLKCNKVCGPSSFCTILGTNKTKENFDIMLTETDEAYIAEIGSEKGNEFLKNFKDTTEIVEEIIIENENKLNKENLLKLKTSFHHPVWEKNAERCLSCAACTTLCPTCSCFALYDDIKFNFKEGKRERIESSCQLKNFTRVAGNFVFREERHKRLKQRIYHKFDYFKEDYHINMCIGCGRCISQCPTKINMVEMINEL